MASVGVNGAAAASLNERFIKCAGCKVNVPKEDMLAMGKCTVCGLAYAPVETRGDSVVVHTVAFAGQNAAATPCAVGTGPVGATPVEKPKRKRWVELTSKRGRTYYHNTDTGEDTWVKPIDIDAEAIGNDGFVPFKNDAVKNAVLREQAKIDATKMGLPAEVIATLQQQQLKELQEQEEQDPLNNMLKRPTQNAKPKPHPTASKAPRLEGIDDADHDDPEQDDEDNRPDEHRQTSQRRSAASSEESAAKPGSCVVM